MRTSFFLILLGAVVMAGCRTSTSPGTSTGMPITPPNAGSYFVLVSTYTDSTGAYLSSDTETETFEQTGFTIAGKTNVDKLVDSYSFQFSDSGYIHYESDGDVSALWPGDSALGIFGTWITYPFGTQTTVTATIDTTFFGNATHMVLTLSGAGTGSTTIKGQAFQTEKVTGHIFEISSYSVSGQTYSDTVNSSLGTISFAPSLGDVIEENNPGTRDPYTGAMGESDHQIAIDYVLK
ncbi:MAG TPA: hypothetical protein VFH95_05490 [Candidatus Kapabacteria bacterium]|nr:hypothetical protein [Candidatus Kapabacteria bacterium]